jgi:hypothetical protein
MATARVMEAIVLTAGLAVLCDGCDSSGGGAIPMAELGDEYGKMFCRKIFSCCDATERSGASATSTTEAACVTAVSTRVSRDVEASQADIDAGRTVYDGAKARRCVDSVAAASCTEWAGDDELSHFPDCHQVVIGTAPPGAVCARSTECANGYCGTDAGASAMICIGYPRLGEACSSAGSCQPGLYCAFDAGGLPTTCATPQPNGSPCDEDAACRSNNCPVPAGSAPRTCAPPTVCDGV